MPILYSGVYFNGDYSLQVASQYYHIVKIGYIDQTNNSDKWTRLNIFLQCYMQLYNTQHAYIFLINKIVWASKGLDLNGLNHWKNEQNGWPFKNQIDHPTIQNPNKFGIRAPTRSCGNTCGGRRMQKWVSILIDN